MTKKDGERQKVQARWVLEQVPLIEAELNESSRSQTVQGTKRPRRNKDNKYNRAIRNRNIEQQNRDMWRSTSPLDLSSLSRRERLKRSRDGAPSDAPPSKRSRMDRWRLGSRMETPDGADTGFTEDSHQSEASEDGRMDGGGPVVVRTVGRRDPMADKPDHLLRKTPSSAALKPRRRSARIAARKRYQKPS